jgi:hypothetical protein
MKYEITNNGSTETIGDNNQFATEQEAREAIEKLKAFGGDWAEGEYDVRQIQYLTGRQKEEIKEAAHGTAQMFVDEFNEALDPSKTDWDGTAWQEDRSNLSFKDALGNQEIYDEAWTLYQAERVAETERLSK